MIDAWLRASEKTTSPSPASADTTPAFARKPEPNSRHASAPLNAVSRSSRRRWIVMLPEIRREAPEPAP